MEMSITRLIVCEAYLSLSAPRVSCPNAAVGERRRHTQTGNLLKCGQINHGIAATSHRVLIARAQQSSDGNSERIVAEKRWIIPPAFYPRVPCSNAARAERRRHTQTGNLLKCGQENHGIAPNSHRVLLARAQQSSGGSSEHIGAEKRWTIPPAVYRGFPFPDLRGISGGLDSRQRAICGFTFLAMLAGVAWLRNVGAAGLVDGGEPLFAEAAREMIASGDYLTPQFNGLPLLDKPILIYWLMGLSVKVYGTEVWAFRLPSCLCAMGLLTGLFLTVIHFGVHLSPDMESRSHDMNLNVGDQCYLPAIIAAAAFSLNLQVVAYGSAALLDMLFACTMGGSLLSFFWGYAGQDHNPPKHSWGYPMSAVSVALACLSNGPMGFVFPACVCACFLLCTGELVTVFVDEFPKVKGFLTVLLVNLPWYGSMVLQHGLASLTTSFGLQNIELVRRGIKLWGGQPWYGLAIMLLSYFPWSLSLPSTLMEANPWKYRYLWKEYPRSKRLSLFAAIWVGTGFCTFALLPMQLLSCYLPVAPAVAILAASHLSLPARYHSNGLATGLVPALVYQLLAGMCLLLPGQLEMSGSANVAGIGRQLSTGHLHLIAFGVLAVAGTLATRTDEYAHAYCPGSSKAESNTTKTFLPVWVLHAVAMVAITSAVVTPSFQLLDKVRQLPVRQLARKAATVQQPGESLIMVGERMPSVVFYSQLATAFFETSVEAAKFLEESRYKKFILLEIRQCESEPRKTVDLN